MTKIVINIDQHTAPQFFEYLRWLDDRKQKRHAQIISRLTSLQIGQQEILEAAQKSNADRDLILVAREAKAVIDETASALDKFTPESESGIGLADNAPSAQT